MHRSGVGRFQDGEYQFQPQDRSSRNLRLPLVTLLDLLISLRSGLAVTHSSRLFFLAARTTGPGSPLLHPAYV